MNRISKDTWLLITVLAVFLTWKLSTLHFRFGDENVYFYMTKAIGDGLIPYKDFNLADPPFFIYLLTIFKSLIGSHFILFKIWPPLFDSASAVLIFIILKTLNNRFAVFGSIFYLFSFTILSTSDYVTGAELMVFLMLLALYLDLRKHHAWSGALWALACLCKLYAGPALLGFLAYKLYKKEFHALRSIIISGVITSLIVLLPFVVYAPHETVKNLLIYQLHRPAGLNKGAVLSLFFEMEWFLVVLGIIGAFMTKYKHFAWSLLFSFIFFLWFKDLYYLYLHLLVPFLVILAAECIEKAWLLRREFAWGIVCFYALVLIYPITSYTNTIAPQGVLADPEEIALALKDIHDNLPMYGVQEVTPLVALMAGKQLFNNAIDTNTQNFLTGALDRDALSKGLADHGGYLMARIADYPEQGIRDKGFETYFSEDAFKHCERQTAFTRTSPGDMLNKVAIYKCL